jgi:glycosyltransferase involved in cell wall biosynthesis
MATRVAMLRSKSVGGIEPRLAKEARALAEAGYEVHAILWDRDLAYPAEESRDGYAIHRIRYRAPYNRPSLVWKLPLWQSKVFRRLRALRPDVVHAADFDTAGPALRAKRAWGARFVFDVWDFYPDMITARVPASVRRSIARREKRALQEADLVILFDLIGKDRLGFEPRRLLEIRNVPEEASVSPEPHDRFVVFYGGNLSKDRGIRELVRACEVTGTQFLVAGQGPDEAELVPLIESSPIGMYLGQVSHEEILKRTANADVIPILYDPSVPINRLASPNKLYEAMMFAKPVLASEGTALADLVRSEGFGLTVPHRNAKALREALERLSLSPDLCTEFGRRGRAVYESRYRWSIMKARLIEAYAALLGTG